jgi:hypothetical protein
MWCKQLSSSRNALCNAVSSQTKNKSVLAGIKSRLVSAYETGYELVYLPNDIVFIIGCPNILFFEYAHACPDANSKNKLFLTFQHEYY